MSTLIKPKQALNKAFLKLKPNRSDIEMFKSNLLGLINHINESESEEFHKNLVSDFLKKTYYDQTHFINTKGRNDLVIHHGKDAKSTVGVIIEAKSPTNKTEMLRKENLNTKAFQELVLYYLRERITHKNLEIKYLVATNIYEWFIFDAQVFDKVFAQNKTLVKQFTDFEEKRLAASKTDFFYKEIAEPFIGDRKNDLVFTHFDLREYDVILRNNDKTDDHQLIALYKLLSPEHLLKLPFTNDSNSLDKAFYAELLHIIGLTETKEGGKKLIGRKPENQRNRASLLENAITQLDSLDKISRLDKPRQFGDTPAERLFNIGLELSITWMNRILFLKLLEAQLITYHRFDRLTTGKGDKTYSFLNFERIKEYDDLNALFFQVLAKKPQERNEDVKKLFHKVPYLNSSLFEPTELEHTCLFISQLQDEKMLPIHPNTVLKDNLGKKRVGELNTLEYLFEFLNAYDFSSEGSEEIQEDNKTLINASVLGLIFEKINGYKDGSFFTPGFITMYMCRETIRRAVVQKFNEAAQKSPLERGFRGVFNSNTSSVSNSNTSEGNVFISKGAESVSERRKIIPYNPKLKELARELRNNSTKSEIILWKELKGKFEGKYDFHRQKPLDNYIADFFCHELQLVIEVDGETHHWEETQEKDFKKELRMNELGLNVLRFSDADILKHLNDTLGIIKKYIEGFEKGNLSALKYEDTPLNPFTQNEGITSPQTPLSREDGNTPFPGENGNTPLSREDGNTPLSREVGNTPLSGEDGNTPLSREDGNTPLSREDGNTPLSRGVGGVSLSNETESISTSRGDFTSAKKNTDVQNKELFTSLEDIYEQIGEDRMFTRQQANAIVNSIKICDPAVGSGHFLVSALNEMIAIKSDLKILQDREGKRLKEYQVEVVNDELIVTDEEGELFEYTPLSRGVGGVSVSRGGGVSESQRVQETLFHEKQTIIENCLFGVDINPNSVKICRLRLWIELLKSAYYKHLPSPPQGGNTPHANTPLSRDANTPLSREDENTPLSRGVGGVYNLNETEYINELETLPNIDINIKCGNSLISRFALDSDLKQALKKSQWNIDSYKLAVQTYRNAESKEQKREMEQLIATIKSDFRSEINKNDKDVLKLHKLSGELVNLTTQTTLFDKSKKEKEEFDKKVKKLTEDIQKQEALIEEIKNNKIYENAFEWRFEFPEVLNDEGDFVGFDVVIGNPPYMRVQEIQASQPTQKLYYENKYQNAKASYDIANIFFELAVNISSVKSNNAYIFPHKFFNAASSEVFRNYLKQGQYIDEIAHFGANMIFEDADTYTCVAQFNKKSSQGFYFQRFPFKSDFKNLMLDKSKYTFITYEMIDKASKLYGSNQWVLFDDKIGFDVFEKIYSNSKLFSDVFEGIFVGLQTSRDDLYVLECLDKDEFILKVPISGKEYQLERELFKPFLMGKDVQRYSYLSTNRYVFFPYELIYGNAEVVSIEDLKTRFPKTYCYVNDHQEIFKARESGKANKMQHWHTYIYPKNLNKFEQPKLSSMEICANHPNVTLNHEKLYHTTKAYSWVKKEDTKESYEYLLAIANSKLLWWFLKTTGDTLQGDARTFKTNYLNPFPLPASVDQNIENEISNLVKTVMEQKKLNEKADTTSLENQIDQLVYQLYELTEEEIKIVEGRSEN